MKTKFLEGCIGIAIVILSIAFFLNSIGTAKASPTPDKFFLQGTGTKTGKYQACFSITKNKDGDNLYLALILDTESGKTVIYYSGISTEYRWKKENEQLPSNPFIN